MFLATCWVMVEAPIGRRPWPICIRSVDAGAHDGQRIDAVMGAEILVLGGDEGAASRSSGMAAIRHEDAPLGRQFRQQPRSRRHRRGSSPAAGSRAGPRTSGRSAAKWRQAMKPADAAHASAEHDQAEQRAERCAPSAAAAARAGAAAAAAGGRSAAVGAGAAGRRAGRRRSEARSCGAAYTISRAAA